MRYGYAVQGVSDDSLDVVGGRGLDADGHSLNDLSSVHCSTDSEVELCISEVAILRDLGCPNVAFSTHERNRHIAFFDDCVDETADLFVEDRKGCAQVVVVVVGQVIWAEVERKRCECARQA